MHWKHFKYLIYIFLIAFFAYYIESATATNVPLGLENYKKKKPGSYNAALFNIEQQRRALQANYLSDIPITTKVQTLHQAKSLLKQFINNDMFTHWLGTKYDFNGTTQTPGEGKIACGYFVTTVLRDVGYPINRVKMAQAASEKMIKSLVDEEHIHRFNKVPLAQFIAGVEDLGEGLFVVGLDTHTGFLHYDGVQLEFIHSTGFRPRQVVRETAETSRSLKKSKYKVVGKITDDEDFLKRWITYTRD